MKASRPAGVRAFLLVGDGSRSPQFDVGEQGVEFDCCARLDLRMDGSPANRQNNQIFRNYRISGNLGLVKNDYASSGKTNNKEPKMNDRNLPGDPAGMMHRLLAVFILSLIAFGANAESGDSVCAGLYVKSGAIQGTSSFYSNAWGNTPINMSNHYCVNEPARIKRWCGNATRQPARKNLSGC
jgi:hypothetical protein